MDVLVRSWSLLRREALAALLVSLDLRPATEETPAVSVAIWDLVGFDRLSYPSPPNIPTVALVLGDEHDVHDLLLLGYRGYIDIRSTSRDLRRALESVLAGELWAERRIVARAFARAIAGVSWEHTIDRRVVRG